MKRLSTVVVLATAWGSRFGGINAFSADLCCALARVLSDHKVVCLCLCADEADRKAATEAGLAIVSLNQDSAKKANRNLVGQVITVLSTDGFNDVDWWIGHDAITGELALACADETPGSKCAVLMHMSYEDYSYIKHTPTEANVVSQHVQTQRHVLKSAHVGVAVGPLLCQRLQEIRGTKKNTIMLVPGLAKQAPEVQVTERLHAITFGRFESDELLTKQVQLAVTGFAKAVRAGFESQNSMLVESDLTVIGAPPEMSAQLRALAESEADRVINLKAFEFIDDRDQLYRQLQHCNVCLMLSWHEGFGLSAWEAIGTGIPVIVSRNSGVFRLLNSIGGSAVGCVVAVDIHGRSDGQANADDVEATKRAILAVASDIPKALANARSLRHLLRFQYRFTWDRTAHDLAQALALPTSNSMLDRSPTLDQQHLIEPADVIEGLEIAKAQRVIQLAEANLMVGEYVEALKVLESLKQDMKLYVPQIAMDATLVEAEVCFRLNRYPRARALSKKAAAEAAERSDWLRYIRACSVENGVLRDQGRYPEALELAEELLRVAEEQHLELSVERAHRLVARSSAFTRRWDKAVRHAGMALDSAQKKRDRVAEAKAALALGEGYRHGLNQEMAIKWYKESRDLAGKAGNVDCFLWAVLGLADSLFLLDDLSSSADMVMRLQKYVGNRVHPLESLHIKLSDLSILFRQGHSVADNLDQLVQEYGNLGIPWPREYVSSLAAQDYTQPKRF